jgi:hypothetical protein
VKIFCRLLTLMLALLLCASCAPRKQDWFATFRQGFTAEVTGELCGEQIAARVVAEAVAAEGVLPLTVTFYAPKALEGAALMRDAAGDVRLQYGDMALREGLGRLTVLLDCFPTAGAIDAVSLNEAGHTEVRCGETVAEYLSDGTPFRLLWGDTVSLTVLDWQQK